jgi:3-hydroxyisobutyrate dehydrogenase
MTMSTEDIDTKVGWIGTGVMGAAMCSHLIDAGCRTSIHTRSREKAADLEARGATWRESPAEVAASSDITFAIVGFPSDVRDVFLGGEGLLAGAEAGDLLVDMTTSEPSLAIEINETAKANEVGTIDAPVSGGDVGAREAKLSIMVGGHDDDVARVAPLLQIMGSNIVHVGGPGAGQHTKMVNQILIASGMIGVCEALLYAQQAGLDMAKAFQAVSGGAAGSWSLSNYGPRMLRGDFEPGFYVDHFVKDMGIALDEASAMRVAVPGLALARQLYVALQAQGGGHNGTQALLLALAELSDIDWVGNTEID